MIKLPSFCDLYGINEDALHQCKFNKTLPASIFKKVNNVIYIDEKYIIRRYEFRRWVTNKCHEYFYYLERYFPASTIAYMLWKINPKRNIQTWNTFMSHYLFSSPEYTVLNFRIKAMMWEFFRYCRWILIHLFKIKGFKFRECDLNKVHELENK